MSSVELNEPWLVAAWPGMGAVAHIAGSYLVQHLDAVEVAEIPAGEYFDVQAIAIQRGLVRPAELPRNRFYGWKHPAGGPDLLIFVGEAQPSANGYHFCEEILETAKRFNVSRVVTFAAMATAIHPTADARVLGVATDNELLRELRDNGVELLADGQIGGLNGVLLSAALEQNQRGYCLLGEFPYFASAVPNPKASSVVLRAFADLAEIELDLEPIKEQAESSEKSLVELLGQLQQAAGASPEQEAGEFDVSNLTGDVDPEDEERIESLFNRAESDRSTALELKAELDRLGLFKRYEDRFLDLFRPE